MNFNVVREMRSTMVYISLVTELTTASGDSEQSPLQGGCCDDLVLVMTLIFMQISTLNFLPGLPAAGLKFIPCKICKFTYMGF